MLEIIHSYVQKMYITQECVIQPRSFPGAHCCSALTELYFIVDCNSESELRKNSPDHLVETLPGTHAKWIKRKRFDSQLETFRTLRVRSPEGFLHFRPPHALQTTSLAL